MTQPNRTTRKPRNIIVTGGANGIGFSLTTALLAGGDRVAILDVDRGKSNQLAERYQKTFLFMQCDLTDEREVKQSIKAVAEEWANIDILINNACSAVFKKFKERPLSSFREELDVNLFGYIRTIQAVLPIMTKQKSGVIHNFSSGAGITGFPGISGYTASKGAIEALTKTLALELAPKNISVNLIHPPLTRTTSSAPLGIPVRMMEDPEKVGYLLAHKIGSKRKVITPDVKTAVFTWLCYRFPYATGKLLARMTSRAAKAQVKNNSELT